MLSDVDTISHWSKNALWGLNLKKMQYIYIWQSVEVKDSAVLGGVVEAVSLIPAVGHKIFFSGFWHS